MKKQPSCFPYEPLQASIALQDPAYFYWDSSIIKTADGVFHLFVSRWPSRLGFGWNWLFNSEIVHATSKTAAGPFAFKDVVLPRRGRQYFDGMNTHNASIRYWNGHYYLYYMGTTYGGKTPNGEAISGERSVETWNKKRIGLSVSSSIDGPFIRKDTPLLEPRDCSKWDCTITTNPSAAILPDGTTYLIYKSRRGVGEPLQLGIAKGPTPEGPFTRLSDDPILQYENSNIHVEDPFLWYNEKRKVFGLIAKDDSKNGDFGLTGEWGAGFYAESEDCLHFVVAKSPKAYSRQIVWQDGGQDQLCNLERPSILFNDQGEPERLYFAAGKGKSPYGFIGTSFVLSIPLKKKKD
jgi:hypothetical protein